MIMFLFNVAKNEYPF